MELPGPREDGQPKAGRGETQRKRKMRTPFASDLWEMPCLGQEEIVDQPRRPRRVRQPEEQPDPPQPLLLGAGSCSVARMERRAKNGLRTSLEDEKEGLKCRRKPQQGPEQTTSALREGVLREVWGARPGREGF